MTTASALCRSRVYGTLSLAFAEPGREALRNLRERVAALEPCLGEIGDEANLARARALRASLARLSLQRWRAEHVRCFGYAISKECPPYEAEYDQANLFQKTHTLADIAGFYRAFGVQTAPELHERVDHVSVELEFMEFLCLKQAHAARRERIGQCRAAQARFVEEHLGAWSRGFARRLRAVAGRGFFAILAELLGNYVDAEAQRLGVRLAEGGRLNEAPELADDGCAASCAAPPGAYRCEVMHERT